jgi:hypothetical protein
VELEPRTLPAANVLVSVVAGDLIIKSDPNNRASVQVIANETSVGSYTVGGSPGTTINGASFFVATHVTRDVKVTFDKGSSFGLNTSFFPSSDLRDVIVNMGVHGGDVLIDNVRARNVIVTHPAADVGDDTVGVNVGVGTFGGGITGNVTVTNQKGSSNVTINAAIGGNLTVSSQDGNDTVNIASLSKIGGAVNIADTSGATGNTVNMKAHVGRGVTITSPGLGVSTVNLNNAVVGGNLSILGSAGGSSIDLSGVTVFGSTLVVCGAGKDSITTDSSAAQYFGGNARFSLGTGENLLVLGGIANGARTIIGGNLTVTSGDDVSLVAIGPADVLGTTSLSTGAGPDLVYIDDSLFAGNVSVKQGGGDNKFEVETVTTLLGAVEFLGNLALDAGPDSNTVVIAGPSASTVVNVYGTVSLFNAFNVTIDPTHAHRIGHPTFV